MTRIIRCSSTDRVLACASSLAATSSPYSPNTTEAHEGQAAHECMARLVMDLDPEVEAVAAAYAIDEDSLSILVAMGRQAWKTLRPHFPDPEAEAPVEIGLAPGLVLRGTSDVLGVGRVIDWKFGWKPSAHPGQLMSYALAGGHAGDVLAWEVWIRLGEIRAHVFTRETLERHRQALVAQAGLIGEQYGPGEVACKYCQHQNHCRARGEWMRGAANAIAVSAPSQIMPRDLVGRLYGRSRALYSALRRYDEVVDALLAEGPLDLYDGTQLVLEEKAVERLVASDLISFAQEDLAATAAELDEIFSATKGGLERVLKGRAAKGQGAKVVRETMEVLRHIGAVETVTKQTKKVERIDE